MTIRGPASPVTVVNNVSMAVSAGRAVGLVGESGAGKSMTAYAMMRLFPTEAASITGGRILFDGVDLVGLPEDELRRYRGARIAIVFQEPSAALNPLMPVIEQVMEGIEVHHGRRRARERALEVLRLVGLEEAVVGRYPHMLSGGQRQRVLIAMAVAPGPALLIANEPTSGLDVTIQAQILDLISRLHLCHAARGDRGARPYAECVQGAAGSVHSYVGPHRARHVVGQAGGRRLQQLPSPPT